MENVHGRIAPERKCLHGKMAAIMPMKRTGAVWMLQTDSARYDVA